MMIMKKYLPRNIDKELEESLEYMGAVLITGSKWRIKQHMPNNIVKV